MKAVILEAFGDADQLQYQTVDSPQTLPPLHVLVRVHASGVNPLDIQTRRGDYADSVGLPLILGSEASGVVEAVGEGVDNVGAGDEVFYMTPLLVGAGTYAQQHVVPVAVVVRKPSTLTHVEAARAHGDGTRRRGGRAPARLSSGRARPVRGHPSR